MMLEWLLAPVDASRAHDIATYAAWHARAMMLAWIVLFPLGIGAARFFKITPKQNWPAERDNKTWWFAHLGLQYSGGVVVLAALGLIWFAPGRSSALGLHGWFGWTAIVLCAAQFLGGWLRGSKGGPEEQAEGKPLAGDHYDMTTRRRIFEHVHKVAGYVALLAALAAFVNGLWAANAPRWMWLSIGVWLLALAGLSVRLQRRGSTADTYQAIWGPDPAHPGNQLRPIGWGVRRRDKV
jgi:hypothetical protein